MARDFVRRVLVVDDDALLRSLLSSTLSSYGFETQTAENAITAHRQVKGFDPDVLLVDIDLGEGVNGLELVGALGRADSSRGYVILSNYSESVRSVPEVPYISYLNKQDISDSQFLVDQIEGVLRGATSTIVPASDLKLTKNQMDLLRMLSDGMSNHQIAESKKQSLRAVEQLISRTYKALGLESSSGRSRRVMAAQVYKQHLKVNR